ncbi:MAG: CehA/McbA family metallohydrolase [Capsulimonadales bacterium]|nr:CehA/McbA family metallohydrolase [Capsulimonadales bacterium]
MEINAFSRPGRFWKGNLHTHSTRSDGRKSPEAICREYREAGYDFLAVTDHFLEHYGYPMTDTRPFRTEAFTTLIGAELHTGHTEFGHLWHILAVGLPLDFAPYPAGETGPEVVTRALAAGAFVAAAHPAWYGLSEADIRSLGPIHAVETYNATSADHNDRDDSQYIYDLLLMRGERYFALATDDTHSVPERNDAQRGWVQVRSETLEPEALLEALRAGAYYSSTGPQIFDIAATDAETIRVRCSPAERVWAVGFGSYYSYVYGNGITEVDLPLKTLGNSPYFRVIVRDHRGGRAWSNPIRR